MPAMIVPIAETLVEGRRLGRHLDLRTATTRATVGAPPLASELRSVRHASSPNMPLNQGQVGSCTGNALCGALNTVPHWASGAEALTEADALDLYSQEEQLEGFGPYPPNDQGGTGQYACEAGVKLGWLSGFQVAADIREALLALMLRPVITGVNWYTSFDTPDDGMVSIAAGATVRGGHEIERDELFVPEGVTVDNVMDHLDVIEVWGWQSWGADWGVAGRFGMSAATWQTLLAEGGDVVVPRTAKGWCA